MLRGSKKGKGWNMPKLSVKRASLLSQVKEKAGARAKKEDVEAFERLLSEDSSIGDFLQQLMMTTPDYTKRMAQVGEQMKALEKRESELESWKEKTEAHYNKSLSSLQQVINTHLTTLEAVKKKALTEGGASVEELTVPAQLLAFAAMPIDSSSSLGEGGKGGEGGSGKESSKSQSQAPQSQAPQSQEKQTQKIGDMGNNEITEQTVLNAAISGFGAMYDLERMHRKLFAGTEHEDVNFSDIVSQAQQEGVSVADIYNRLYNPQARKAELDSIELEKAIEARAEKLYQERISKHDPLTGQGGFNDFTSLLNRASGGINMESVALKNSGLGSTVVGSQTNSQTNGQNGQGSGEQVTHNINPYGNHVFIPPSLAGAKGHNQRNAEIQAGANELMAQLAALTNDGKG